MLRIQYDMFDGLHLHFFPSKDGTDLGMKVLKFLEEAVEEPVNKEVAHYFAEVLQRETGAEQ